MISCDVAIFMICDFCHQWTNDQSGSTLTRPGCFTLCAVSSEFSADSVSSSPNSAAFMLRLSLMHGCAVAYNSFPSFLLWSLRLCCFSLLWRVNPWQFYSCESIVFDNYQDMNKEIGKVFVTGWQCSWFDNRDGKITNSKTAPSMHSLRKQSRSDFLWT